MCVDTCRLGGPAQRSPPPPLGASRTPLVLVSCQPRMTVPSSRFITSIVLSCVHLSVPLRKLMLSAPGGFRLLLPVTHRGLPPIVDAPSHLSPLLTRGLLLRLSMLLSVGASRPLLRAPSRTSSLWVVMSLPPLSHHAVSLPRLFLHHPATHPRWLASLAHHLLLSGTALLSCNPCRLLPLSPAPGPSRRPPFPVKVSPTPNPFLTTPPQTCIFPTSKGWLRLSSLPVQTARLRLSCLVTSSLL